MARARQGDVALLSVGDLGDDATLSREGILDRADRLALRRAGAAGDVLCPSSTRRAAPWTIA